MSDKKRATIKFIMLVVLLIVVYYLSEKMKFPGYVFSLLMFAVFLTCFIINIILKFRNTGGIVDIPPDKVIDENEYIKKAKDELKKLEFDIIGKYYEGEPHDIIIYAFRHKDALIWGFLNQSFKKPDKISFHCVSFLSDDYTLLTALDLDIYSNKEKAIIQSFKNTTYRNILKWHITGIDVLKKYNLDPLELTDDNIIERLRTKKEEEMKRIKSNLIWPILIILSSFNLKKKVINHRRPVEEQIKKGTLKIRRRISK